MQRLSQCAARQYHGQITRGIYLLCHQSLSESRKSFSTARNHWRGQGKHRVNRARHDRRKNAIPEIQRSLLDDDFEDLEALEAEELEGLEDDDLEEVEGSEGASTKNLEAVDPEDLGGLSPEDLEGLDPEDLKVLEDLSPEEIELLSKADPEDLAFLDDDDIAELDGLTDLKAAEKEGLEVLDTKKYGHLEDAETRELRGRILQLEEEIKQLQTGESLSVLPVEGREVVKGEHARATKGSRDVRIRLLPEHEVKMKGLNECLAVATVEISSYAAAQSLWRSYTLCRHTVPSFFVFIPEGAWDVLWESQYRTRGASQESAKHLTTLLDDMMYCKRNLSPAQKMVFIESLQAQGSHSEAILLWQKNETNLRASKDTAQYFEDLGVQVYATADNPQRAQALAFEYLKNQDEARATILTPLIGAWLRQGDEASTKQAWSVYLRLRMHMGSKTTLEVYDDITTSFLDAGRIDLALAVFKDMMLTGQSSPHDSTELYCKAMGLFKDMAAQTVGMEDITKVSLATLTVLPPRFQNKFFFASWLKKLLGMGKIDAAISVLELMIERGVKADPKHLNGVIAALLRSGNAKNAEKALQMGWAMVDERLIAVTQRKGSDSNDQGRDISTTSDLNLHKARHLRRIYVPPATVETFSLLLLYFERRSMSLSIKRLKDHLRAAEIAPNAYFMNHLIYAELRQSRYKMAWDVYSNMTKKTRPDLETFAALWDCRKSSYDQPTRQLTAYFPHPRRIFSDMMNWFSMQGERERKTIVSEFSRELYMQIVRCLGLAKDTEGTLVGLHAMKESFRQYPDDDTARMVTLQVSRLGESTEVPAKRRRQRGQVKDNSIANLKKVTQVLKILADERDKALQFYNISRGEMNEEQVAEESLYRLTELLRTTLGSAGLSDADVEESVEKAAWEMGTSGIKMHDPIRLYRNDETMGTGKDPEVREATM